MKNAKYGSSLTDAQWEYLEPMLPKPAKRGRRRTDLRQVLDAIFYVIKGGTRYAQVHVEELRQAAQPWPKTRP